MVFPNTRTILEKGAGSAGTPPTSSEQPQSRGSPRTALEHAHPCGLEQKSLRNPERPQGMNARRGGLHAVQHLLSH